MRYLRCNPAGDILSSGESTLASGVLLQRRAQDDVFWVSEETMGSINETKLKIHPATGALTARPGVTPAPLVPPVGRFSQLTE